MAGLFDVPRLVGRWAELWSMLGLVHSRCWSLRSSPCTRLSGTQGPSGPPLSSEKCVRPLCAPCPATWGVFVDRRWRFPGRSSVSEAFQPSSVASPCLSFPWEAVEEILALSKLEILLGLFLISCVSWGGNMTSPASTASYLIGMMYACLAGC